MTTIFKLLSACACAASFAPSAEASVIVNVNQTGGNVVVTASGTLDTSSLNYFFSSVSSAALNSFTAGFGVGPVSSQPTDLYGYISSFPSTFGFQTSNAGTSGAGDMFGVTDIGSARALFVPSGFISGGAISSTSTYAGANLVGLGMTPGTYHYAWQSDSITLNVAPVPLPPALPMAATAIGLLGFAGRRWRGVSGQWRQGE